MTFQTTLQMSNVKLKQATSATEIKLQDKGKAGKPKAVKKRKYFYEHQKKKAKEVKNDLPPKHAEEFSTNWKALLEVLNSEQKSNTKEVRPAANKKSHKDNFDDKVLSKPSQSSTKDLSNASDSVTQTAEEAGEECNRNCSKRHQSEKKKTKNGERGQEKRTDKRKKAEERPTEKKKPTEADIWFDDVDPEDIEAAVGSEAADIVRKRSGTMKKDIESAEKNTERLLVKDNDCDGLTRAVAMDCEMVGVGPAGEESMLARVSIVNYFGKCVYDKYVKPTEKVTDYRTAVSGIRPADIKHGENFKKVQREVAEILKGRILVGHAIHNDLKILLLDHPKKNIRDTQKYKPFRTIAKSGRPALRVLCREILNVKVQQGEHSSVQDAQATMRLYTMVKKKWEAEIKAKRGQAKSLKNAPKPKAKSDQSTAQTQITHES